MIRLLIASLLAMLAAPLAAHSESRATGVGFDLTATGGIRFLADAGLYEASGEVQLVVGDWVVLADRVVAALDTAQDQVASLTADGTVFVQNDTFKARADSLDLRFADTLVSLKGTPVSVQMGGEQRLVSIGSLRYSVTGGILTIPQDFVMQVSGATIAGGQARLKLSDGSLQALDVTGGVEVQRGDFRAAAEALNYAPGVGTLLLEGAVVLQSGEVLLSGASASFDLDTGAVQISNDSNQRIFGALSDQ